MNEKQIKDSARVDEYHEEMKKDVTVTLTGKQWSRILLGTQFVAEAIDQYQAAIKKLNKGDDFISFLPQMQGAPPEVHIEIVNEVNDAYQVFIEKASRMIPDPPDEEAIRAHVEILAETGAEGHSGAGLIIGVTEGEPVGEVYAAKPGEKARKIENAGSPSIDNMVMMGRDDEPEAC